MVDFSHLDRVILQTLQMPDDATIYYKPVGGARVKLDDAIFRSPDTPIEGDDLIFEGTGPQFAVHREDCPSIAQGDTFERSGKKYTVTTVRRDEGFLFIAMCREA